MLEGIVQNLSELQRLAKSISGELNSEMFYKQLDYLSGFNEYFDQCKSLSNLPNRQEVQIICARLLKYLENYKFSKKKDNEYDICILLNYWVYNKLNGILQSSNDSYIYRAFGDIERIWSSFIDDNLNETEYKTCKAISNTVIHYDWRERKELYDYCVNYDALKKILQSFETKCQEYWTYVENHTSIYEHFEKNCSNPQYDCPGFYEGCKKYNPKHVLSEFKCNTEMMDKKVKETTAKARPSLQADIPAVQEPNSRMPTSPEFSSGDSHLTREGTHPATKTGDILLGVVATSLTSAALYRFTPLGRILRNRFGRNNNNMGNLHGGEYGLFDYASESYNPFTGGGEEHYIGYQPA